MAADLRRLGNFAFEDDELMQVMHEHLFFADAQDKESTFNPNWPRFDLNRLTDAQSKEQFRFYKDEIIEIANVLRIPNVVQCRNRCEVKGLDALCMTLRRMAYPNRLSQSEDVFGRPTSVISFAINETVDYIYQTHGHLLHQLDQSWLNEEHLRVYADAIHESGAPLDNCFGFIDGTVRPICRPIRGQRSVFNGHKRVHSLKFQSMVLPNGILANLWGPVEGRRHDAGILADSGLHDQLDRLPRTENGESYYVYGDPAYPVRPWMISPFRAGALGLNEHQQAFNTAMAAPRTSVEWTFGKILQYWAFVDFKKDLKVFLQPVAKYYLLAGLLTNIHTCLRGSLTGGYFELDPPTLEDYVGILD